MRRRAGFTLVEVVTAASVLTLASLALFAALSAGRKAGDLARERAAATNAIASYLDAMRLAYPTSTTSKDMTGFYNDTTVPSAALAGFQAQVFKCADETGTAWDSVAQTGGMPAASTVMAAADKTALALARDLDGDGNATTAAVDKTKIIAIPVKVTVTWVSGAGGSQRITTYAYLGPHR